MGHAMPQAVNRQPLTSGAGIQFRSSLHGICGGQSDTGHVFLPVLVPFPVSITTPILRAQTFLHRQCRVILATDSVIEVTLEEREGKYV